MSDQPAHNQGERTPTGAELTALDPTFWTDPHPVLARLRRNEPAHYDAVINRWVLTRHDDVERVVRDRTMSLDPHKANAGTYMRLFLPPPGQAANMLFSDPPDHTRLRALVNKGSASARRWRASRLGSPSVRCSSGSRIFAWPTSRQSGERCRYFAAWRSSACSSLHPDGHRPGTDILRLTTGPATV